MKTRILSNLLLPCLFAIHACAGYAATKGNQAIKFAVLGDAHLGLLGEDRGFKMTASSERIFEIAVEQLNKMPDLSFVLFDGDMVTDGESFNYARFKELA